MPSRRFPTNRQAAGGMLPHMDERDDLKAARAAWAAGQLAPYRITAALNDAGLHGPDVDAQLGAQEPAVDHWEDGTLYPTFQQFLKLVARTRRPWRYFTPPPGHTPIRLQDTTMIYHDKRVATWPDPVLAFTPEAIASTLSGHAPDAWLIPPSQANPDQAALW